MLVLCKQKHDFQFQMHHLAIVQKEQRKAGCAVVHF